MTGEAAFKPDVRVFDDKTAICQAARRIILKSIENQASTDVQLSLALSGGSTPRELYQSMHTNDITLLKKDRRVLFVIGDERLVSATDKNSNYNMAYEALLHDVPEDCVLTIDPQAALSTAHDPEKGEAGARVVADLYDEKLMQKLPHQTVKVNGEYIEIPLIDVVLLGFGADGHTASIFPNSTALKEQKKSVTVSYPSEKMHPKVWRVTLTPYVIQNAKHIVVMVAGKDKNWVVRGILDEQPSGEIPVSRFLRECKGKLTILLDKDAADGVA